MTKPTCDKCQNVFSRLADKRYHQQNCGESVCVSCGARFSNHLKLWLHDNIHKEIYKCKSCSKCFSTKQALDRHRATHNLDKSFQCSKCSQLFTIKTNLTRHMEKTSCGINISRLLHGKHTVYTVSQKLWYILQYFHVLNGIIYNVMSRLFFMTIQC